MKKFYSLLLLLTAVLFSASFASAATFKLTWETAGSIALSYGSNAYYAQPQDVSGLTEWDVTFGNYSNIYVAVSPAAGYKLVKAVQNEDPSVVKEPNADGLITFGPGGGFDNTLANKSYTIVCEQVAQNDAFNVNVVNGLDYITATYSNGATLTLEAGEHSYAYNADVDGTLTIAPKGIPTLYSVTLDGTAVEQEADKSYKVAIANGSNLVIQAFENPESNAPETCKLTFEYGANMEGCILNIRDWTTSSFIENQMENNVLTVAGYSDIQLNFVENDYTIKKVYLNGEDITSLLVTSSFDKSQKIRFVVPNQTTATIKIEGTAKVWGTVNFTGFISGAEGVEFSETYGGAAMTLPAGADLTTSYSVGGYTLSADNAKKYVFPISEKSPKMFFRPKAGYYIAQLYVSKNASPNDQNSGAAAITESLDGTYFWMVVKPLGETYSFDLTTVGSTYYGKLSSADQSIIANWDNPEGLKVSLTEGSQVVPFYPSYSIPAVITVSGDDSKDPAAYLDGAPLTGSINADSNATEFTFTPYYPTASSVVPEGTKSDVKVYLSTARPTLSGASLVVEEGATAGFFYSPVRHVADPAGQTVISGTQMIVRPGSSDYIVTYKDEVVELNEDGDFVFNATGNARNNVVTVSPKPNYADMLVDPADGATVKSLSTIKITLPCVDPNFESMLDYNEEVLPQLTVTKGAEVVAQFGELGDPTADDEGNTIIPIILSEPITAAGTYTINIPEKAFVQKAWSDADEAMVAVAGGFVTPAYAGTVTVDPEMISICDDYTLSPASGETVDEISVVKVTFNKLSAEDYFSGWEFTNATFTNGETTIEALVNYDWMSESENRVMTVTPIDAEEEPTTITEAGTWTLTIAAGTFSYNGETNGEITAEYTIASQLPLYTITPASGSTVDNLSEITIEFPGVTTVEYNDTPITLVGTECNSSSTEVYGTGNIRKVSFRNPTVDGEYTVTFPAGAFTLDGQPSEEATATYTFQCAYALTPESGSTIKTFEVAIAFPHATEVEYVGGASSIILTNNSSYASPSINCVKDATATVPTFLLTLPETASKPSFGTYDLIIEEGAFQIDGKENVAIFANYNITPDVTAEYIISPNGTIVYQSYGYDFAVIFDESASLSAPVKSAINLTFDGVTIPATSFEYMVEGNMLLFMVTDTEFCKEGVLNLNIAENTFSIGGASNPAIAATWNVVAPKAYTVVVTPEEGESPIAELETIYVNFPDATSGEVFNQYGASLRNTGYTYSATGTITLMETRATGVTFAITFPKTTTSGTYKLTVLEGTFTLDGVHSSPEIENTYIVDTTTGIAGIFADEDGNITVYTIDGKLILNSVPAAEIHTLNPGLYIINGKKVMLK